ncbi:hypothetical protein Tco_0457677 [Tanacetum coccineum]
MGSTSENTKIYIDNESTICIVKNPVYHSKTKHIAIRHHFIRDAYEKKLIQVLKIHTDDNVADLLTKAFDVSRGLIGFRESLRRVIDGTEALLLPTLFILWLDTVSTDSAKGESWGIRAASSATWVFGIDGDEVGSCEVDGALVVDKVLIPSESSNLRCLLIEALEITLTFPSIVAVIPMSPSSSVLAVAVCQKEIGENMQIEGTDEQNKGTKEHIEEDPCSTKIRSYQEQTTNKESLKIKMMTYLKHVGNFKHAELKIKKFEEVQALYEKIKRSDEDFISIGSAKDERLIKRMNEKELIYLELKRIFLSNEWKTECSLDTKPLLLRKLKHFERLTKLWVIKSNGQKRYFSTLMRVLSIFGREDLIAVYQLVMNRFQDETPEDWKYCGLEATCSSGVHTLLKSEEDSTMALELIRFIKKILAELESEE